MEPVQPIRVRHLGDFLELSGTGRPLSEAVGELEVELARNIARYLRAGTVFAVGGGWLPDRLDMSKENISPVVTYTDGLWLWRADLAYYVDKYRIGLPAEFVNHAREYAWAPPPVSAEAIEAIGEFLMSRGGTVSRGIEGER